MAQCTLTDGSLGSGAMLELCAAMLGPSSRMIVMMGQLVSSALRVLTTEWSRLGCVDGMAAVCELSPRLSPSHTSRLEA